MAAIGRNMITSALKQSKALEELNGNASWVAAKRHKGTSEVHLRVEGTDRKQTPRFHDEILRT